MPAEPAEPAVLVVGPDLPEALAAALDGLEIEHAPELLEATRMMRARVYACVVVHPSIREEDDGVRFAHGLRERRDPLLSRYAETAIVVLPFPGALHFAVFDGGESSLVRVDQVAVADVIRWAVEG